MSLALWFTERREVLDRLVTVEAQLILARREVAAAKHALRSSACKRDLLVGQNLDLRAENAILRRQNADLLLACPADIRSLEP